MYEKYSNHDKAVYAGYLKDTKVLMTCASGGIGTALAEHFIANGGYVAGVVYEEDFSGAKYLITNQLEDLDNFKGSKYIEVEKGNIYEDVIELLEAGEQVLFLGLPCTVAAIKKVCKDSLENLYTCELICHGPTSAKVHKEYVDWLIKKYHSNIVEFSVRYKKEKWDTGYLHVVFENGGIFEKPFYDTEYGKAFSILGMPACYNCQFKGNNRAGDIMIGDFWGASEEDEFWNEKGVSVIFAETDKGEELLKKIDGVNLYPVSFERAVEKNQRVMISKEKNKYRDIFEKKMTRFGLFAAVRLICGYVETKKKIKSMLIH